MTPTSMSDVAFTDSIVTARCVDCGEEFTGNLAVRFIETPHGKGIEIMVHNPRTKSAHSITRMQCATIPTVSVVFVGTHGHA
jgi:hypothetical protein